LESCACTEAVKAGDLSLLDAKAERLSESMSYRACSRCGRKHYTLVAKRANFKAIPKPMG